MGWERPRIGKQKISFQAHSYPTQFRKFPKNSIKIKKIKKHHSSVISNQNGTRKAENEKKETLTEFVPT